MLHRSPQKNIVMADKTIRPNLGKYDRDVVGRLLYQVNFYFSDANLRRDKYLRKQIEQSDGWVDICWLNGFRLMRALDMEPIDIAFALSEDDRGIIDVSDDGTKVRRRVEIPRYDAAFREEQKGRTVMVQGLPLDVSRRELQDFFVFNNFFGDIQIINLRSKKQQPAKIFSSSVTITFASVGEATQFAARVDVEFSGAPLKLMMLHKFAAAEKMRHNAIAKKRKLTNAAKKEKLKPTVPPLKGSLVKVDGIREDFSRVTIKQRIEAAFPGTAISHIANIERGTTYMWLKGEDSANKFMQTAEMDQVKPVIISC